MKVSCTAYLAMSLDGFIAGENDDLEWLDQVEPIKDKDYGYADLLGSVDALVMGRRTFETVIAMDTPWTYTKPVLVISSSLTDIPEKAKDPHVMNGTPKDVIAAVQHHGWSSVYIDGGALVTSFIDHGLLDELIVSIVPVAIGGGIPLFGSLNRLVWFRVSRVNTYSNGMVKIRYKLAEKDDEDDVH